jgi:hypothetical protein
MRLLLRVLAVVFLIVAAWSVVRGLLGPATPSRRRSSNQPSGGGKLVKDPVCGTYVPEATALRVNENYFCSEDCRRKFVAES